MNHLWEGIFCFVVGGALWMGLFSINKAIGTGVALLFWGAVAYNIQRFTDVGAIMLWSGVAVLVWEGWNLFGPNADAHILKSADTEQGITPPTAAPPKPAPAPPATGKMKVTRTVAGKDVTLELPITQAQLDRLYGPLAYTTSMEHMFPNLSKKEREFVLIGWTPPRLRGVQEPKS